MSTPTLYRLIFKNNGLGDYDVYEQHRCQDNGCFWTEEKYVCSCLPGQIDRFIEEYNNDLIEGKVDEVIVDHYIEVEEWVLLNQLFLWKNQEWTYQNQSMTNYWNIRKSAKT